MYHLTSVRENIESSKILLLLNLIVRASLDVEIKQYLEKISEIPFKKLPKRRLNKKKYKLKMMKR